MSCQPDKTIYRLLDAYTGWDPDATRCAGIVGFQSPQGIRLQSTGNVDPTAWSTLFSPPRLAWNCRRCEWLLVTPRPARVLVLGQCHTRFEPLWEKACAPTLERGFRSVACRSGYVAMASADGSQTFHFDDDGRRLRGVTDTANVVALAYAPNDVLVAACQDAAGRLSFLAIDTQLRTSTTWSDLAAQGPLRALRVDANLRYWFLIEHPQDVLRIYSIGPGDTAPVPRTWRDATFTFDTLPVELANEAGFCIQRPRKTSTPDTICFDWYGRCADHTAIGDASPPAPDLFLRSGDYYSLQIDSGIPECQWHRIELDVDLPPATHYQVLCGTSEDGTTPAAPTWAGPDRDTASFLIGAGNQGSSGLGQGRYLHLHINLSGDGQSTPRVSRVRAEFPRTSTLDHLPPIYRNNIRTEDFTGRFLSLFDTLIQKFDSTIEQSPALLDAQNAPDEVVRWLCTWLDIGFDVRWSPAVRRRVLKAVPSLYARRGTPSALREAVACVLGIPVSVQELGPERAWGSVSRDARLDSVRLFGRSAARIRLGTSTLGRTPIKSFGNPDRDPLSTGAFRFRVLAPETAPSAARQLADIIASQKPAHTVESVRGPADAWIVGLSSTVAVDTRFARLPAPVLGRGGNIRLRRRSVLARGRGPADPWASPTHRSIVVGARFAVGVDTLVE